MDWARILAYVTGTVEQDCWRGTNASQPALRKTLFGHGIGLPSRGRTEA